MARYNKIYAGPVGEVTPHVTEALAVMEILPGRMITMPSGSFELAASNTTAQVFVAQDNYLICADVDTPISVGNTVCGLQLLPEQMVNVRVAAGTFAEGAPVYLAASGRVDIVGARLIGYADETALLVADDLLRIRCR